MIMVVVFVCSNWMLNLSTHSEKGKRFQKKHLDEKRREEGLGVGVCAFLLNIVYHQLICEIKLIFITTYMTFVVSLVTVYSIFSVVCICVFLL